MRCASVWSIDRHKNDAPPRSLPGTDLRVYDCACRMLAASPSGAYSCAYHCRLAQPGDSDAADVYAAANGDDDPNRYTNADQHGNANAHAGSTADQHPDHHTDALTCTYGDAAAAVPAYSAAGSSTDTNAGRNSVSQRHRDDNGDRSCDAETLGSSSPASPDLAAVIAANVHLRRNTADRSTSSVFVVGLRRRSSPIVGRRPASIVRRMRHPHRDAAIDRACG